jgi:hypothetical protein
MFRINQNKALLTLKAVPNLVWPLCDIDCVGNRIGPNKSLEEILSMIKTTLLNTREQFNALKKDDAILILWKSGTIDLYHMNSILPNGQLTFRERTDKFLLITLYLTDESFAREVYVVTNEDAVTKEYNPEERWGGIETDLCALPIDTEFFVHNGHWPGKIVLYRGIKSMSISGGRPKPISKTGVCPAYITIGKRDCDPEYHYEGEGEDNA